MKLKKNKTEKLDFKPTKAGYRDSELAMKRDTFGRTKDLFKRRAKKKDHSR